MESTRVEWLEFKTSLANMVKSRLKHRQLWLMLIILPTWINLLLKAYAFIGIFGQNGSINQFLEFIGIGSQQLLFTDFSFIFVASYIELPFMILPIFNVLDDMDNNLINASYDLGATKWETFRHVIFPLSMNGVRRLLSISSKTLKMGKIIKGSSM